MKFISKLRDRLRTLAGIRQERQLAPISEKPVIGSNIVREKLRIRLKYPITDELWKWLSSMGWRVIDMRNNQRRYIVVPDKVLVKLIKANQLERVELHARLIKAAKHEHRKHSHSQPQFDSTTPPKKKEQAFRDLN